MSRRRWLVVAAAVVGLIVAGGVLAWTARSAGSSPCGRPTADPLDPNSLQHPLPGAPPPAYATEPPTSGPHQPGRITGVVPGPLPRPVQVGALEAGQVLLQHRDLAAADRRRLEALAGARVVVAPNPDLPLPVVASAWRTRLLCRTVDVDALQRFAAEHAGQGPAHAG